MIESIGILLFLTLCAFVGWKLGEYTYHKDEYPRYRVRRFEAGASEKVLYEAQVSPRWYLFGECWYSIESDLSITEPLYNVCSYENGFEVMWEEGTVVEDYLVAKHRIREYHLYQKETAFWQPVEDEEVNLSP